MKEGRNQAALVRRVEIPKAGGKVRAFTRRTRGDSLGQIIADLNPMLRGWYGYFKHAHGRVFQTLDAFIRRRLRALLRKQVEARRQASQSR